MRRVALFVAVAIVAAFANAPVGADTSALTFVDPGVGGFMSPNLSYVGTLATDAPGVGARIVTVNGQRRLYVSSIQGLRIWDVTDPGLPLPLGALELPHWENEDVTVSRDGKTVLMSEFTGTYMHVIEVLDLPGGQLQPVLKGFTTGPSGHIVDCIDDDCDIVYGSEGVMIDLHDKANPVVLSSNWATMNGLPRNGHNLNFDETGLLWTDTTPIAALDVSDPVNPVAVFRGDKAQQQTNRTAYQHNNIRPNAALYQPRDPATAAADPNLRPGELLMGNGETNFTGTCGSGSGPFSVYKIKDTTPGNTDALQFVDQLRPVSGQYADGNPAVNRLGCSGHWFTVQPASLVAPPAEPGGGEDPECKDKDKDKDKPKDKPKNCKPEDGQTPADDAPVVTPDYLVAAAWYEHGTRLLSVDKTTGEITQKGYFQPVVGSASAAHWIDDEYIYVVDYERGVDILRYDAGAPVPSQEQIDASWLAKLGVVSPLAEQERYACRLVTQD